MFTACTSGTDVLTLKFVLPEYFAVIECRPVVRAEVEKVAWPTASRVPVPMLELLSRNETVPLGVPPALVTAAVNVTATPAFTGFTEAETVVVVAAGITDWLSTAEVLVVKEAVPAYWAVIE